MNELQITCSIGQDGASCKLKKKCRRQTPSQQSTAYVLMHVRAAAMLLMMCNKPSSVTGQKVGV